MKKPRFLESEPIFQQKWAGNISKELYELSDGRIFDFYRHSSHLFTNILVITKEQECILTRQYRYGVNDFVTDICGGIVEEGEDPKEAAKREMEEETGYTTDSKNFTELAKCHVNPARSGEYRYFYLATEAQQTLAQNPDEFEDIEVILEPFQTTLQKVMDGTYQEPNFCLAVLKYAQMKNSG